MMSKGHRWGCWGFLSYWACCWVPARGIDFYSIEVLAVMVVTVIYLWVYSTLRLHSIPLVSAQVLTVLTVGHGLLTFNGNDTLSLFITAAVHIALQWLLNSRLRDSHDTIYRVSNLAGLVLTGGLYGFIALGNLLAVGFGSPPSLVPVAFIILAMLHTAWFAYNFFGPMMHLTAITWYFLLGHVLMFLQPDGIIWSPLFMAVAIVQVASAFTPLPKPVRQAFLPVGLVAIAIVGWLAIVDGDGLNTRYDSLAIPLGC